MENPLPHHKIKKAFEEAWENEIPTDDAGKLLNILSLRLGIVVAELTQRGVSWEVVDRNIKRAMLRGVEHHLK